MALEHLIGTLNKENKLLVSQEMQRRKNLLDKVRSGGSSFEDVYKQEKEKLENRKKLM